MGLIQIIVQALESFATPGKFLPRGMAGPCGDIRSSKVLRGVGDIFKSGCLVEARTLVRKEAFCIVEIGEFAKVMLSPAFWPPILSFCSPCQYIRIAFHEVQEASISKTLISYCK